MLDLLIREQHGLCAYTMKTIAKQNGQWQAHIEHVLPQSVHAEETLSWGNLLACVPTGKKACDYGAHRKADYDPAAHPFTSPLQPGIEREFRFLQNGRVEGRTARAQASIEPSVLYLNHGHLVADRRARIQSALSHRPTATQARKRAAVLRTPDREGKLEAYGEALAQVLDQYAQNREAKADRTAGKRRAS
jgi:uncharacterized protein (TIGR02646 family)